MQMEHQFTVPVPVDVAWSALLDPERVAPCMPGATLTSVEGSDFAGSVKVKMGPVSLMYKGNGSFSEVDAERRRVVIDAGGKDARGNGTASATVTAVLSPGDSTGESTEVRVDTDLKVTGKPAQLGRGLISDVAGKLLNQFADCLAERLRGGEQPAAAAASSAESVASPDGSGAQPSAAPAATESAEGESSPSWRVTSAEAGAAAAGAAGAGAAAQSAGETVETPSEKADAVVEGGSVPSGEAIDLLDAAGAPVLKRVLPVLAVVGLVVGAIVLARRRRSDSASRGD